MENKKIMWIIIAALILLVIYPNMKSLVSEKFAISDSDLTKQGEVTIGLNQSYNSITITAIGSTITFTYSGISNTINSGGIFYTLDSQTTIYPAIPNMTDGEHTLTKYQMFALNNNTQVNVQSWSKTAYISTRIEGPVVYKNQTVEKVVYVDKWTNGTQTVYVNNTVYQDKVVTQYTEPTLQYITNYYWAKYKWYIVAIAILIFYYYSQENRRRR